MLIAPGVDVVREGAGTDTESGIKTISLDGQTKATNPAIFSVSSNGTCTATITNRAGFIKSKYDNNLSINKKMNLAPKNTLNKNKGYHLSKNEPIGY